MSHRTIVTSLMLITALTATGYPDDNDSLKLPQELNEHLSVFAPLIGKTFKGEFENSTPEKPVVDVSTFERAMNGQAVRSLHSINDGQYGGESIYMWDSKQEKIAFWYFTTAGFHTQGTIEVKGNQLISEEDVTGNENGITKVRAVSTIHENGNLQVESEYFTKGEWKAGRNMLYKPAADAKVRFK